MDDSLLATTAEFLKSKFFLDASDIAIDGMPKRVPSIAADTVPE